MKRFITCILLWTEHVERKRLNGNLYRVLVGNPKGRRPRPKLKNNIKIDLREIL
jgi:hypothetical protein